jgi:shikimate dehydrogenase
MICVTGNEPTVGQLEARLKCISRILAPGAGIQEVRLDFLPDPQAGLPLIERLAKKSKLLVCCRPPHQGGHFSGSQKTRFSFLAQALDRGAWAVDVEWKSNPALRDALLAKAGPNRTVVSHHLFEPQSANETLLAETIKTMATLPAQTIKLAVYVDDVAHIATLRNAAAKIPKSSAGRKPKNQVLIPMGRAGVIGRVCYQKMGSAWTYVAAARNRNTALGQLTLKDAHTLGLIRDAHTPPPTQPHETNTAQQPPPLFVLFGGPQVHHSFGPLLYNPLFRHAGLAGVYLPAETRDLSKAIAALLPLGLAGAAVTMPFKQTALRLADTLSFAAQKIGAVNTLVRTAAGCGWQGHNTDGQGVYRALRPHIDPAGRRVSILGAGGAGRAAAWALKEKNAHVTVFARRHKAAETLARALGVDSADWDARHTTPFDILINATPVGSQIANTHPTETHPAEPQTASLDPGPPQTPFAHFPLLKDKVVLDMVTHPRQTPLLRGAHNACARAAIGGLEMWIFQGLAQLESWTGHHFTEKDIRDELDRLLASRSTEVARST